MNYMRAWVTASVLGALRDARNIDQRVLAEKFNCSNSFVSSWETNRAEVTEQVINLYSQVLDITKNEIFQLIDHWTDIAVKTHNPDNGIWYDNHVLPTLKNSIYQKYFRERATPRTRKVYER